MIIGITGHRPDKLGGYNDYEFHHKVKLRIMAALVELGAKKLIAGMAQGADWLAYDAARMIGIPILAAVPFVGQESKWPWAAKIEYCKRIDEADNVVIVNPGGYAIWKMQQRNEWIVDNCDVLLAVWDGSSGGTNNCINYAVNKKPIYYIPIANRDGVMHVGHYSPWWTQDVECQ